MYVTIFVPKNFCQKFDFFFFLNNFYLLIDDIKRYHPHKTFGDRRKGNTGARTYFYQNEAQCEKNMEIFLRCIEAVAGMYDMYSLILIINVKKIISLDSTRSTGFSAIKLTALGRPNLLVSPETH